MHEIFKIKLYLFLLQNTPSGMSILGGCSYLKRHFSVCLSSCFPAIFPLLFCSTFSVPFLSLLFLCISVFFIPPPLSLYLSFLRFCNSLSLFQLFFLPLSFFVYFCIWIFFLSLTLSNFFCVFAFLSSSSIFPFLSQFLSFCLCLSVSLSLSLMSEMTNWNR